MTFLSSPANQKCCFVSSVVLFLRTADKRTRQTRTQLPYVKHTSSVPIQVVPSTLQVPQVYTCSTHYIKYASDVTRVVLGQLGTPTMHFTLPSDSSNTSKEYILHSTDVQVCTQEVHKYVPACWVLRNGCLPWLVSFKCPAAPRVRQRVNREHIM